MNPTSMKKRKHVVGAFSGDGLFLDAALLLSINKTKWVRCEGGRGAVSMVRDMVKLPGIAMSQA
jgi:hypothetical protein